MGDQLNLAKISDYIQSNNYNIDDRIISLLERIEFDASSNLRDINYSVGRMYLKARDKRALEHLLKAVDHFEVNRVIIEINMMIGVYYLREKNYEIADRYFMACYPLMPDDFEFDGENWPWIGEETSSLDLNDRIDLYGFLTPYFEHIDINIYFGSLLFQLRCNETVQLLRTGHHKKALIHFDALFDSMPYLNMSEIEQLRIEFREKRKHDLRVQIFDMATLFHYQAITHWSLSDFNIAKSIFHESMDYREDNSHYLDLSGTYSNIAMVNNNLELYEDAVKYYEKSLELVSKFGEEVSMIPNLKNLIRTYQLLFEFDNALLTAKKAVQICENYDNVNIKIEVLQHLGLTYHYLKEYDKAIYNYEKCMKLASKINNPNIQSNIIYNLIFLYNRVNQNQKSKKMLAKLKILKEKNINNRIMIDYFVSTIDYNNYNIDNEIYHNLLQLIISDKIELTIFETAVLQLINIDILTNRFIIFNTFKKNQIFSHNIKKLSNPSIIYYFDLLELLSAFNIEKQERLKDKIKSDISISNDIQIKKIMQKILDEFDKTLMKDVIKIVDQLIIYNLNFRFHEIKNNYY